MQPDRDEELAHTTHLPILKALSETVSMRRVLEYGAGNYSTPFFIEKAEKLVTIETDPEWHRWPQVKESDAGLVPLDFDLIFIDDGKSEDEREATILSVLTQPHPLVVIHDAEVYESQIKDFAGYHFTFRFEEPHTALCWTAKPDLDLEKLAQRVAELT